MSERVNYKQLGTSGLRRFSGYVYEEFLTELRWPRAGEVYKEMSDNDPVIGAVLYLAEMLIRKARWNTAPVGDKPVDKEAAEFLNSCMNDMDISWADTICEVLSMLTYGFSFHEVVYKIRRGPKETNGKFKSKYNDGRISWRRIPIRAQSSLAEWIFADDNDIKAFVQDAEGISRTTTIPLTKGLLFRTRVSRDNPEGKSMLRNAYRPWYFKKRIEEIEGIGIERDLAGLPLLQAPEGMDLWAVDDPLMAALRGQAEELVASIRRDSEEGVLLPAGWKLELLSTGSARQFDTNAIIDRYDNRIAITLLSDLVLLGGGDSGSFALAETKQSLLAGALEAQIQNIADVINKYAVPKLFEFNNFPGLVEYPIIVPGQIEIPGIKELALLLRAMGLDISKDMVLQNYLREISSLPTLTEEEFKDIYEKQGEAPPVVAPETVPVVPGQPMKPNGVKPMKPNGVKPKKPGKSAMHDTTQNDFEQNDMNNV